MRTENAVLFLPQFPAYAVSCVYLSSVVLTVMFWKKKDVVRRPSAKNIILSK